MHRIPLEDWAEYIPVPEMDVSEMTLRELLVLAEKLENERNRIESIIEERIKQMDGRKTRRT
jgi:hypothetical protein